MPGRFNTLLSAAMLTLMLAQMTQANDRLDYGVLLYKAGRYPEAVRYFEQLISVNPADADPHYLLANTLMAMKKIDRAEEEYVQALQTAAEGEVKRNCRIALTAIRKAKNEPLDQQIFVNHLPTTALITVGSSGSNRSQTRTQDPPWIAEFTKRAGEIATAGDASEMSLRSELHLRLDENQYGQLLTTYEMPVPKNTMLPIQGELTSSPLWGTGTSRRPRSSVDQEQKDMLAAQSQPFEYHNNSANRALVSLYNQLILEQRARTLQEIAQLRTKFSTADEAVAESKAELHKMSVEGANGGAIKVFAPGSNVYSRNYETTADPTGGVIPLIAEPKSMPTLSVPESKTLPSK